MQRLVLLLFDDGSSSSRSLATRSGQTNGCLERIVHEPLERSEGTNHEDTRHQARPASLEAEVLDNVHHGLVSRLVQLAHNNVSRVRHNGAEHTSNVTSQEGDSELLSLGVLILGLGESILVDGLNSSLKGSELYIV